MIVSKGIDYRIHKYWLSATPRAISTKSSENESQLNPAIVHFKGLVKIMLYTKVFIIASAQFTMKMLLETKILMHYWRDYIISGYAIAGFHCT